MKFIARVIVLVVLATLLVPAYAQRKMENLDRGLVAVKVTNGVFLSWRIQGYEWLGTTYNVYRNGAKLNTEPLQVSNFTDAAGTISSTYTVSAIVKGVEQPQSALVTPLAQQYLEVPLKPRNATIYEINDATAADLDGDGNYEIIVKRIAPGWNENNTNYSYFEAYKLDGTFLWEINVGPNILPDVEINIAAFDFDGDGKAEVFMRTSEGTIFGNGVQIGDTNNDGRTNYRYSVGTTANMQYMNAGPEFLSLIDGLTGVELDRVDFIPRGQSSDWGDSYGHRASKYFFGAPYLDGVKPSLFIGRGIYTKTIMRTYDVVNKKLVFKWEFNSGNSGPYYGQGNHNYTIADVDGDGCDEMVWGSMTVDNDGKGLYSTQLGHGDALHVGDLDPYRKGIEIFKCLEESPHWGTALYEGATGKMLIHHVTTYDCGRCMAANISDDIKGKAVWGGAKLFSASTLKQVGTGSVTENYRIYWDGDLLEEQTDHTGFSTSTGYGTGAIFKHGVGNILTATGSLSCNYTKGTPSLQADLFGDWREEVIWRRADNQAIRIYTTINPTIYRNYTLMHDHQYRQAICWQMCGYNQPPHVSYFLGEGEKITVPPPPVLTNNRYVYGGAGNWDKTSAVWHFNGNSAIYTDNEHVLFDISGGANVSLSLGEVVMPEALTVNSRGNYNLNASTGKLSGEMVLAKQGAGTFTLNGIHDFTGNTNVWDGKMVFSGELQQSAVWLNLHAAMEAEGKLSNGATIRYGAYLSVGAKQTPAVLVVDGPLSIEEKGELWFDLASPDGTGNDLVTLNGNLTVEPQSVFRINPILTGGATKLEPGDYNLIALNGNVIGDLSKVVIEGINGSLAFLTLKNGHIVLEVKETRASATLIWNGALQSGTWDFGVTQNFTNNGTPDLFIDNDNVVFNDDAVVKNINIASKVRPASVVFNNASNYTLSGDAMLSGASTLTKTGSGVLSIQNVNDFTGKVLISEGTIEVSSMPNLTSLGALGPVSADPLKLEINGGTLKLVGEMSCQRAARIGTNGGTIDNNSKVYWKNSLTNGNLTKTGSGNLILGGVNSLISTTIKAGSITLLNDETSPGTNLIFEGGVFYDNDNMYSYNTSAFNIEVPAGKTGTIHLDSRCYYTGALTGAGALTVNIPNVRSDLNGNWSAFTGNIIFNSTYSNSNNYPAELRFGGSNSLTNASVILNANVHAYHMSNAKVAIGALTGTGTLGGSGNWEIGNKNTHFTFAGKINSGSLTKVGTGRMTLSNESGYTGSTTVNGGSLIVANSTGSATGTGIVTVNTGAAISGTGTIAGRINVNSGGNMLPGNLTAIGQLTVNNNVTFYQGSVFYVDVDASNGTSDLLKATGTVSFLNATLQVSRKAGTYKAGDSFKVIDAPTISGTITTIVPAAPGDGLVWDLTELNTSGTVKIAVATSVGTIKSGAMVFYPNPTSGVVHISVDDNQGKGKLMVQNINGQTIKEIGYHGESQISIDLEGLNKGLYVLKLELENKVLLGKVLLK